MKSAIQWFDDAVTLGNENSEYYVMAKTYRDIGLFNQEITLNIEEASDKGMYAPYWENIKELIQLVSADEGESEIIELEVYRLAAYSIETYARKFKSDGVEEQDMRSIFQEVKQRSAQVDATSDKTQAMHEELMQRFDAAELAFENAYIE